MPQSKTTSCPVVVVKNPIIIVHRTRRTANLYMGAVFIVFGYFGRISPPMFILRLHRETVFRQLDKSRITLA